MNPGRCGRCHQSLSVPCQCPGAPRPRGFAAMSPERRRAVCSMGGKTAQARRKANRFTTDEARAINAGRTHEQAREIGRLGGLAKKLNRLVRDWETDQRPLWMRALESRGQRPENIKGAAE